MRAPAMIQRDRGVDIPHDATSSSTQPLPALIVTDRPTLMQATVAALAELGRAAVPAASASAAQHRVLTQDFSEILLDAEMAQHEGQALLRYRNEYNTDVSVVLIGAGIDATPKGQPSPSGTEDLRADPSHRVHLACVLDEARTNTAQRRLVRQASRLLSRGPDGADAEADLILPRAVVSLRSLEPALLGESPVMECDDLVRRCGPLATDVLRLANHVSRPTGERYDNLRAASTWLGLGKIHQLAQIVAARRLFAVRDPLVDQLGDQIWLHSLARAEAMQVLADRPGSPPRCWFGDIYRAGLFADAGASFILWLADRLVAPAPGFGVYTGPIPGLIAEHHEWMGEELVRRWGMADDIARMAGNHHRRPSRLHLPFWPLGLAAGDIADEVVDSPERASGGPTRGGDALDLLRIESAEHDRIVDLVRARIFEVRDVLDHCDQFDEPTADWHLRRVP